MFDRHRIVSSNGALTESFFPGNVALPGIDAAKRDEIIALFPELAHNRAANGYTALRVLKEIEARILLAA